MFWRKPQIMLISRDEPSVMAQSMTSPRPVRWAFSRPATMPKASSMPPPPKSPTMLIGGVGFSPARPKACSAPETAM